MPSLRNRLLVAAVSAGAAAGAGWWALGAFRSPPDAMELEEATGAELLLTRRASAHAPPAAAAPGRLVREPVDEATARTLFVMPRPDFVYDPLAYYRYRGGLERTFPWPEHDDGKWTRRTNSVGLRNDEEVASGDVDLRVLVTGDSHTDGACNNSEAFAARLEELLRADEPSRSVEVLNAGVSGYSFYNYLGALERYLPLEPEVFVVAVYAGNDFVGALRPHHYFSRTRSLPKSPVHRELLETAMKDEDTMVAQTLNQTLQFHTMPDEADLSVEVALAVVDGIRRVCAERGIGIVFVLIPNAFEAGWPELRESLARSLESMELSERDLAFDRSISDRFLAGLRLRGLDPIDMTAELREAGEPCYWRRDLHIDPRGHARVARRLHERLAGGVDALPVGIARIPDGPRELFAPDGRLLERGAYRDGIKVGTWTVFHANGRPRLEGEWRDGRREGTWSLWYADGALRMRGEFRAGRREGEWTELYPGGSPFRTTLWRDGQLVGRSIEWHANGAEAEEGGYEDGEREGIWRRWSAEGVLLSETRHEDGHMEGLCRFYHDNGSIAAEGEQSGSRRVGPWTEWYAHGQVSKRGSYDDAGRRTGRWELYSRRGELDRRRSGEYVAGERVGE